MPESTVSVLPIYAYTDNYIWCITNDNHQAWVVDPGHAGVVEDYLSSNHLKLKGILVTHHHWDHITGIKELIQNRDIPVYGPDSDKISEITNTVSEGDLLRIFDLPVSIMEVPGHTKDHIAYLMQTSNDSPALFCGDTLFSAGCGRVFDGSAEQLFSSLNRINQLPEDTQVFCTHEYTTANLKFALAVEPDNQAIQKEITRVNQLDLTSCPSLPTTLKKERKINPFMRCAQQSVQRNVALAQKIGADSLTEKDCFIALRRWKDTF